jgi:hypothetical protein
MIRRFVAAAAALALVTGCSGKSGGPLPPAKSSGLVPATFVMHWPAASQTSARRPHFISPSTKSVAIDINDDPSLSVISDNPSTGQAVTSNVAVQAPPGDDTITFSVYDQTGAKGNELGQVTITQTIAPGQANAINAVIDGLVASVELDPLPNQATVSSSTDPTGGVTYTIAGDLPVTFAAKAKDADGNIIVGPGSPVSFDLTSTNSLLGVTPVSGQSNEFVVRVSGTPQLGSAFGVLAHATDALGNTSQSNYSVKLASLTYVAYQNAGTGTIAAFDESGQPVKLPGAFPGLTKPLAIATDPVNHRIYALDKTSGSILAFKGDGTAASGFTPPSVPNATSIMFDYNVGRVYVTNSDNTVGVFNADGSAAQIDGTFPNLNQPVALTLDDVNPMFWIFVANAGDNTYSTFTEDGNPQPFGPMRRAVFSTAAIVPAAIATDSEQILVAGADTSGNVMQAFSLLGTPGAKLRKGLSGPAGATYNTFDGNYYVANRVSGAVTVYDSQIAGLIRTIAAPTGLSVPVSIAFVF